MKIKTNQNFSDVSTIPGWWKTAIHTQSPALSCTVGPSCVFVPMGSLLFSPLFSLHIVASLKAKTLLNVYHFLFLNLFLFSSSLSYLFPKQRNKEPTEIWHGLILFWFKDLTDCFYEATILRPNDSTLLSSAFTRGESLYPLGLRTGGQDLKLDGVQWFHCIGDWNTNDSGT